MDIIFPATLQMTRSVQLLNTIMCIDFKPSISLLIALNQLQVIF